MLPRRGRRDWRCCCTRGRSDPCRRTRRRFSAGPGDCGGLDGGVPEGKSVGKAGELEGLGTKEEEDAQVGNLDDDVPQLLLFQGGDSGIVPSRPGRAGGRRACPCPARLAARLLSSRMLLMTALVTSSRRRSRAIEMSLKVSSALRRSSSGLPSILSGWTWRLFLR